MLPQDVCLSVHHTSVLCQTATHTISLYTSSSHTILVFLYQTLWRHYDEDRLTGESVAGGVYRDNKLSYRTMDALCNDSLE